MELKLKKKKILKIVISFFLLLSILLVAIFIKIKLERPYKELFKYCTSQEVDSGIVQNCEVLLSNYYDSDNGKKCLDIVLPEVEEANRELTLCLNQASTITWENPYDSYKLDLPVVIQIQHREFPYIIANSVDIELMSDQEARDLLNPINELTDKVILFRSSEASRVVEEKGYYKTSRLCVENPNELCPYLGIYDVEVLEIIVEENLLKFRIRMSIMGDEREETIAVDSFQYEEYSYSNIQSPIKRELLDIDSRVEDFIMEGEDYVMEFLLLNSEEITDRLVEQYSEGIVDLELKLEGITRYVE